MEKSVLFPLVSVVIFITKLFTRAATTTIMYADDLRGSFVKDYGFAKRAYKDDLGKNLSAKTGKKEVRKIKESMELI